ncbi:MAG: ATP-binding cassette domain-containing protein [Deltaproteobacteria bacterium]|nr:ATP-binding cassette domain-containing protein [Deltaproteobacteria bacterium]
MIVEARSVSKQFGDRFAVKDLNLEVPAGVCFGLLGPNGAGKSSVMQALLLWRQSIGQNQITTHGPFLDMGPPRVDVSTR